MRDHQDLSFDVDLQDGTVKAIRGPGGLEYLTREGHALLVEDVEPINALRKAMSEAFYSKASPVPAIVDTDVGIDFSGQRGKRDDEPVPQLAVETQMGDAFDKLLQNLREAASGRKEMDEASWSQRYTLRKAQVATINMHAPVSTANTAGEFTLFPPYVDLMEAKREAERYEADEAERNWRLQEEKKRQKEDAAKQKRMTKQQQAQAIKEEERLRKLTLKGMKGKGKGKDKGKDKGMADDSDDSPMAGPSKGKQKGKGKGKDKDKGFAEAAPQPQQPQQPGKKQKQPKGKGGDANGGRSHPSMPSGAAVDLPAPWVAVPDPNTGRLYYWNQNTNDVSWTAPPNSRSQPSPSSPTQRAQAAPLPQAQQDMWNSTVAFMQQQQQMMQMAGFGMPAQMPDPNYQGYQ